jgi:hypothetical protein
MIIVPQTCSKLPDNPPLLYYEYHSSQVSGIIITNADGPQELGRLGSIQFPENNEESNPAGLFVDNPYPNPSLATIIIPFYLSGNAVVSAYIVSAKGPGEDEDNLIFNNMSWYIKPTGKPVQILFKNENLSGGVYRQIIWYGKDDQSNPVPEGFYRIYFQIGYYLAWKDILLFRNEENLRKFMEIYK